MHGRHRYPEIQPIISDHGQVIVILTGEKYFSTRRHGSIVFTPGWGSGRLVGVAAHVSMNSFVNNIVTARSSEQNYCLEDYILHISRFTLD